MKLFHYHLVTSRVREVEARYVGKLAFGLVARHGRIGEEYQSFEAGVSWEELDKIGFKLRLSELERGAVNVVVQPGQWELPRLDHFGLAFDRAIDQVGELVLVERQPEMVDPRQVPLARLDDHVDGAALELGQPQLEPQPVELLPRHSGLEGLVLLSDPAVPRDEAECELAQVARLDLPDPRGDEVVVKELHGGRSLGGIGGASLLDGP